MMSNMMVFPIAADGRVGVDEGWAARNAFGGGWHIWQTLGWRLGVLGSPLSEDKYKAVWSLFGTLDEHEDWVLGMTFDGCWVKRENIPALIIFIEQFERASGNIGEHDQPPSTLAQVRSALKEAYDRVPALLGVCFQITTVAMNLWERSEEDHETTLPDDEDGFPQVAHKHIVTNVLTDTETALRGARIWELGEEVARVREAKRLQQVTLDKAPCKGGKRKAPVDEPPPESTPPDPKAVAVLVRKMLDETKANPVPEAIRATAYHKALVALGRLALPGIFHVYSKESDAIHLSLLLFDVVGVTPVPRSVEKKSQESRAHWLAWGKRRGYL